MKFQNPNLTDGRTDKHRAICPHPNSLKEQLSFLAAEGVKIAL